MDTLIFNKCPRCNKELTKVFIKGEHDNKFLIYEGNSIIYKYQEKGLLFVYSKKCYYCKNCKLVYLECN